MTEDDDALLLARVASRDEAAFNLLYATYLPLVLRWTLRETRDRELAADLTAEVFAAAMLAAPRYRPESGSVGAWLVGIAVNKLRESRRRKRVEDSARRRLKLEPVVLTDADLELVDELVGMDDRLQALIQTLPEEQQRELERAITRFAASQHLSPTQLLDRIRAVCPAVGYVAPNDKHLTRADVASPITVGHITTGGMDAGAVISFIARQPVTSSDSWYELATTGPTRCEVDGNGPIGYGDVRTGRRLTEPITVSARCKGTIHGVVGYMQSSSPTNDESAGSGGTPGQDGSIIVGRFTFTIH